jgi:hypothetical protein
MAVAAATGAGVGCGGSPSPWRFLTVDEARTLAAICDQIIPEDEDPGAAWAGVVNYIDRQLCGPLNRLRNSYRQGIAAVNKSSGALYGANFAMLTSDKQVELLTLMEQGRAPSDLWKGNSSQEFFALLSIRPCKVFMAILVMAAIATTQAGRCWEFRILRFAAGFTMTSTSSRHTPSM